MKIKRLNSECVKCLLDKYIKNIPVDIDEDKKLEYIKKVLSIISDADDSMSAPELTEQILSAQKEILENCTDYSEIKSYFNQLMFKIEKATEEKILNSDDHFKTALLFSLAGNYIDFGALKSVDENELLTMLENSNKADVSTLEMENLRNEIKTAKKLVYLTDNCGEIVLDKLFIKEIKRNNLDLMVNVIVRGEAVLNDCTIEDAKEVDMFSVGNVVPNGTAIAGTCLNRISFEAKKLIDESDLIIAKGQGNFETLRFCNKNIYYLFLCKCKMFAERFNVEPLSGMLINDLRI